MISKSKVWIIMMNYMKIDKSLANIKSDNKMKQIWSIIL